MSLAAPVHLTRKLSGRARLLLGELITAAQASRVMNAVEQSQYRRRIEALPSREQRRLQHAYQQWQDTAGAGDVDRLEPMDRAHGHALPPGETLDDANAAVYVAAIVPHARAQALEDFTAGDIESFISAELDNPAANDALALVVRNAGSLIARHLFEWALVGAFRSGYVEWPGPTLRWLFEVADAERLRALGDPLPGAGPFVVYRGGGQGAGLSWSRDPKVAAFYAGLSAVRMIRKALLDAADIRVYFARTAAGVRLPWLGTESDEFIAATDPGGAPLDDEETESLMDQVTR